MRAFTLIEMLVYLAIFSFLISGTLTAVATIQAANARHAADALVLEEGMFLLEVLEHAVANGEDLSALQLADGVLTYDSAAVSSNQVLVQNLSLIRSGIPVFVDITFTVQAHANDGTLRSHTFNERVYSDTP